MSDLYDTDLLLWTERQGELLRRRAAGELVNEAELDWPNIAEAIEALGQSERSKLRSLIGTVIEHLIKLQASPAIERRSGWKETIDRARDDIDLLMQDSPSLRCFVVAMIDDGTRRSSRLVVRSLERFGEQPQVEIDSLAFTEDQVLGDWLP
jgi:cob(I)alamin adenosyltransferase